MAVYTDDFERAGPGLGANWAAVTTGIFEIYGSNRASQGSGSSGLDCFVGYDAGTFDNNQYGKITLSAMNASEIGAAARCSAGGNGYSIAGPNTYLTVAKLVSNSWTSLGTGSYTNIAGDVVEIRVSGTSVSGYKNNTLILGPYTDTALSSGKPGMASYSGAPGTSASGAASWEGGDLGAGGAVASRLMLLGVG